MLRYLPLLGLLLLSSQLKAQDITGDWNGLLELPGLTLRLTLHVSATDDGHTATIDSPDQGVAGIPLDKFTYQDGAVTFEQSSAGFSYSGQAKEDFSTIMGEFQQGGEAEPLVFQREAISAPDGSPEWLEARLTKQETYITMRDGERLFTSYYLPKNPSEDLPILLWRTPYDSEPAAESFSSRLFYMQQLIEAGYIIAFQDVRGKYQSEGEFIDVRPFIPNKRNNQTIDENSDTYDSIDWLVNNVPGNNGRVGIFGVSYPGFYSTMALPEAHPALRAVSPQAPVTDWFIGDDFHHNGAFFMMDAFSFYSSFGVPRPEPTRESAPGFDWPVADNYDFFLDLGPLKNVNEYYFGDSIAFWNDLMAHPTYDEFWQARNPRPHLVDVTPAVLTVGGWFDAEDSFGPLAVYQAIEQQNDQDTHNRLLMGPWYHGQWLGGDAENMGNVHWGFNTAEKYKEMELEFFNYYLKDEGEMALAEATVFVTGANEWREFDHWPPAATTETSLYLQANGGLSFDAPSSTAESYDEYVADPMKPVPYTEDVHLRRTREYMTDDQRFASRRPDVMVYETELLEEEVTLAGPVTIDFYVSTTGTDADYVVKLIDVFPDELEGYPDNDDDVPMEGYQMLVRGDILRGRFRNSFENPEPFTPGEVTRVSFTIPDVAHTFQEGHRLMIQVQNSWFPLVDRNPQTFVNIYEAEEADFQKATHRIYHEADLPSRVQVRILKD
ncbi:MAG: CocE/NonD family hydrolase [Bacteroidota bacterium]